MKQLYYFIATVANLIMGLLYLWGVENNRHICVYLWIIAPTLNLILFGLFEKYVMEESEV